MELAPGQVRLGGCTVDLVGRTVTRDDSGEPVSLRHRETELLSYLLRHRGRAIPRDELLQAVWGVHSETTRALDMCVRRLRVLVEPDPASPRHLQTVRGLGYRFDLAGPSQDRWRQLPLRLDAFVGREPELEELQRTDARLVLLLGPPGVGKSRLALEHGHVVRAHTPGGVWLCELAQARTEADVCGVVARTLGVDLRTDPAGQLAEVWAHRGPALLVLDNLEHLLEPVRALVERWLGRAPALRVLGTSRERLGLGELEVEVEPLATEVGVRLFHARAGLGPALLADEPRVLAIVAATSGVPLAIELAAARLRGLSVDELESRLQSGLAALRAPRPPGARHGSVRQALQWSWDLLSAPEQLALAQLAVFRGGIPLEGAEAVLRCGDAAPPTDVVLQSLLERHLLLRVDDGSKARFDLLELIRQFAVEQLQRLGKTDGVEQRHGRWAASLGRPPGWEPPSDALSPGEQLDRLSCGVPTDDVELLRERGNLMAAHRAACQREDWRMATLVAEALWVTGQRAGPLEGSVVLLEAVLGLPGLQPAWQSHVSLMAGDSCVVTGRHADAEDHLLRALRSSQALGSSVARGRVLGKLGNVRRHTGKPDEARPLYEDALALHREVGSRRGQALALLNLGHLALDDARTTTPNELYEQAHALFVEVGDRRGAAGALGGLANRHLGFGEMERARAAYEAALAMNDARDLRIRGLLLANLGLLHQEQGRLEEARTQMESGLRLLREVGDPVSQANVLGNLGKLHHTQGRIAEAQALLEQALTIQHELGYRRHEALTLCRLGGLAVEAGQIERGVALHRQALVLARETRYAILEATCQLSLARLALESGDPAAAEVMLDEGEGLLRSGGQRVRLGLALCLRVELSLSQGAPTAARVALGEARRCATDVEAGPESELGRELRRVEAMVGSSGSLPLS